MAKISHKINFGIGLRAILALVLIWGNFGIAFADPAPGGTPATAPTSTPTDTKPQGMSSQNAREQYSSFNVRENLTAPGQEQSYLKGKDGKAIEGNNPVAAFIVQIINLITLTAASLSFLAVVVGGFLMMTSAGNAGQVTKGKEILVRAVVGLVLTLSAYFMVAFVQNLLFETAGK